MIRILPLLLIACITSSEIQSSAEANAQAWCTELQLDCKASSCMSRDTDNDGYVSCTVLLQDSQRVSVECAHTQASLETVILGQNEGCRQKMPINVTPSIGQ